MSRKRTRRQAVSIENTELLASPVFTEACESSMQVLAIVCQLAVAGGFVDLIGLYRVLPNIVQDMCMTARCALLGLKKLENWEKRRAKILKS